MSTTTRQSITVRAPAKVNLSLRVLGRRPDGYHDLDSLMFAISLYDTLRIAATPARRPSVTCSVSGPERVPGGPTNLAARAASAVLDRLGANARVSVRVRKEIPFGAGLGGGSSDAAAVIRCLPALLGRRLAPRDAQAIGRALGADVPFFLACRPARATGIGDRLEPISRVPKGTLLVAVSPDRVNTAWAYRHALGRLTSGKSAPRVRAFPRSIDAVEAWFFNDFQRGVEGAVSSVRRARETLEGLGARATVLSGSGCAMVGMFTDAAHARQAAASYDGPGRVFVARTIRTVPRLT
ncbi:MAG: 4-(cytidine 5'-diphospho)-2-C-methyl-D-erythritol kinase [Candidatus Binatia bacterium]